MMQFQKKNHPIFHRHSEIALKNILYVVQYMNQPTDNAHHSKMQKDGWAKYIPNFAFK